MKFQILGSVSTVANGAVKSLDGGRQRTLMAVMLVNAQQVVTKDQFFAEVWGDRLPTAPDNALQAVVMRVRKVLSAEFGEKFARERLVTHPNGYAMDIDPREVDGHLFELLTDEAKALSHRDPAAARGLFNRALKLWQGPALQGVAGGLICESAATQFEESRLAAVEARIQLDIGLLGHASVISELRKMVSLYPWRERLFEMLMICLYRAGRQAEAVQVYNYLRRRLIEDFGMEPSPNVRKVMMAILHQDPAIGQAERGVAGRLAGPAPLLVS